MPVEVRATLEKQRVLPLATASADGKPNVVYIGVLKVEDDETLILSDNFFKKTAANMEENPQVAIVCWDPEKRKSYQIKGRAVSFENRGQAFEDMVNMVAGIRSDIKVRRVIKVKIEEIYDAAAGPNAGERIA